MKRFIVICAALAIAGGAEALQHSFNSQKVKLDQLPQAARQAIRSHTGGANIQDIDMETFDGFTTYQAAYNKDGQHREVRVDKQGKMWGAHWKDIPAAVERVAEKRIGNSKIVGFHKGEVKGQGVYHFKYDKNGTPSDLWVTANGDVIKHPEGINLNEAAGAEAINSTIDAAGANSTTAGQSVFDQTTQSASGGTVMEFKDLPWPVQQTIMNQAGGANVQRVIKTMRNGQPVYHARFDKNGQRTRLTVGNDGTVLNTVSGANIGLGDTSDTTTTPLSGASKVSFNDLPQAVKNSITAQANGAAIEDVDKGTVNGQTVYEAAFKKEGRTYELQVKEDGSVLGGHFD